MAGLLDRLNAVVDLVKKLLFVGGFILLVLHSLGVIECVNCADLLPNLMEMLVGNAHAGADLIEPAQFPLRFRLALP